MLGMFVFLNKTQIPQFYSAQVMAFLTTLQTTACVKRQRIMGEPLIDKTSLKFFWQSLSRSWTGLWLGYVLYLSESQYYIAKENLGTGTNNVDKDLQRT